MLTEEPFNCTPDPITSIFSVARSPKIPHGTNLKISLEKRQVCKVVLVFVVCTGAIAEKMNFFKVAH
jgi:hypothetical protein